MKLLSKLLPKKKKKKSRGRGPAMESRGERTQTQETRKRVVKKKRTGFSRLWHEKLRGIFWRCTAFGLLASALLMTILTLSLPDIDQLNKFTRAPSILIKSEDGQIIGSFGDIYGDYVPFSELPRSLVDAVIATEDRNFYRHPGVDPMGLLRAFIANVRAGHVVQGGSTVTQQVAKNVFLTPERSLLRKLREMMLAFKLERRFSKEDIMSIYLNRVYLGAGNYGVDAASKRYFGKTARDMTLSESSIIAGLLKAPSRFAPTSNPTLSRKRGEQVLLNMLDAGFLTKDQTERARADLEKSMNKRKPNAQSMFYFADWILDQIPEYVGNVQEDIVVITTLRPDWQLMAEKAVNDVMDKEGNSHNAHQASLLAMTPDGAVRAMIGGRSYAESQFNRTVQAQRQPGSSFKLFVYLAGLESGLTPDSPLEDEPITLGKWSPKNYNGRYLGTMPMRQAVAESINTVAVQVSEMAGLNHVIDVAQRLGINSHIEPLHSIALGSVEVTLLEMVTAYAHLASGGEIVYPYGISQIDTVSGEPVYRRFVSSTASVLRADVVGMMNEMLIGVVKEGTGRGANIGRPIAGKTGTTSDYKDAWFIGFTPDLVAGAWVGNDDNAEMKKVTGGGLPAQIWRGFMSQALAGTPARSIPTEGSVFPWSPSPLSERPGTQHHEKHQEGDLGDGFWDKLMDGEKSGKIEYKYPGQKGGR